MRRTQRDGFTLFELLIVIALMVALGTVALINLIGKHSRDELDSTVQKIVDLLNQARDRSVAADSNVNWSVYFYRAVEPSCVNAAKSFYALYQTDDYAYWLVAVKLALSPSVDFDESSFGVSCSKSISFNKVQGLLTSNATSVEVYLISDPGVSSTISVTPLGLVTYTGREAQ